MPDQPYDMQDYYKIKPHPDEEGKLIVYTEEGDLCEFTPFTYEGSSPIMIQSIGYGFTIHENVNFIEWEIIVTLSYGQGNGCPWVVIRPEVDGGMKFIQGLSPFSDLDPEKWAKYPHMPTKATLYEDLSEALDKIQRRDEE